MRLEAIMLKKLTAKRGGAVGASLWTIEKVGDGQFDALTDYPWDQPAG